MVKVLPILFVFSLGLSSCSSLIAPNNSYAASQEDCRYYDDSYLAWGASAAVLSVVAGAVGVGSPWPEEEDTQLGLGITSAVAGALGAGAVFLSQEFANRFSERCIPRTTEF